MRLIRSIPVLIIAALLAACSARSGGARNQPPSIKSSPQAAAAEQQVVSPPGIEISPTRTAQPTVTPLPTTEPIILSGAEDQTQVPASPTAPPAPLPPTASATSTPLPPTATPTPLPSTPTGTPPVNEQGEIVHAVQPGETIYTIAARYGVLQSQLTAYNQIDPNAVTPGMTLRIPVGMLGQGYTGGRRATATPLPGAVAQDRVVLSGFIHDWQKLNNCGPTTTSVMLSYFGINRSQLEIAAAVKPAGGVDKNVGPAEVAAYVGTVGLEAFVGINGSIELAERLLSAGFPFMVEQWMDWDGVVGHYRAVRGFDRTRRAMLYNDTFLGPDIWKPYDGFLRDWAAYNNTYIVFYRPEQEAMLREIIGPDWDPAAMWERLRAESQARLDQGERSGYLRYGLAEALHQQGRDAEAIPVYEQAIAAGLPWRYLWYRYGYFEALNNLGEYEKTLQVTGPILEAMQASEDLRYHRAVALRGLGRLDEARAEFQAALRDNPNFAPAQLALAQLEATSAAPAGSRDASGG